MCWIGGAGAGGAACRSRRRAAARSDPTAQLRRGRRSGDRRRRSAGRPKPCASLGRTGRWRSSTRLLRHVTTACVNAAESFRKDSGDEPGRSRSRKASDPEPTPAQTEIRRPGPAPRADAPEQLRIHSTEDAPRRAPESEKGLSGRCLQKVRAASWMRARIPSSATCLGDHRRCPTGPLKLAGVRRGRATICPKPFRVAGDDRPGLVGTASPNGVRPARSARSRA